jgi:triacylglycerol lipase
VTPLDGTHHAIPDSDTDVRWWGNHLAETRWLLELSRLLVDPVFLPVGVPRGDARPVLLLPGFLAGDQSLAVLGTWLWRLGYRAHVGGFIANVTCADRATTRVERQVRALSTRSGRRIALIGHSRGGHYVRALGARLPDHVSHAISLGADLQSMYGTSEPTRYAVAAARGLQKAIHRMPDQRCFTVGCACRFAQDFARPFPAHRVRMTSVYSKGDGVVRWQQCLVPYADCVEVEGSHVGLVFNRKSYGAIAAALAVPELGAE